MRGISLGIALGLCAALLPCRAAAAQDQNQSVRVVSVTVTVEGLEPSTRGLTYRTSEGVRNSLTVAPEVALYDEVRVGDVLLVDYIDAIVLKFKPGAKLTNFEDSTERAKAAITTPGVRIEQQLSQVVTIDEVDVQARTVVYHGADTRRVLRNVQDPALMKGLKAGDVVEITMTRERAISLARAQ
jgi:hypothetical protein